MNFDVAPYCERMKQADPKRFEFAFGVLTDYLRGASMIADCRSDETKAWAFIGPLADELGAWPQELGTDYAPYPGKLLEAVFDAVCEKLEAAKP